MAELATPNYPPVKTDNVGDQLTAPEFNEVIDSIRALYDALGPIDDGDVETLAQVIAVLEASPGILNGEGPPTGFIGSEGAFYVDTLNKVLYGPKSEGATPAWPEGITLGGGGSSAGVVRSGNGAPSTALGDIGDFYLNKSTSDLFGPKYRDLASVLNGYRPTLAQDASNQDTGATYAHKFKAATDFQVTRQGILIGETNEPISTDEVAFRVYDVTLTTVIGETGWVPYPSADQGDGWVEADYSTPVSLTNGTDYWFAVSFRTQAGAIKVVNLVGSGGNTLTTTGAVIAAGTASPRYKSGNASAWSTEDISLSNYFGAMRIYSGEGTPTWPTTAIDLTTDAVNTSINTNVSNINTNISNVRQLGPRINSKTKFLKGLVTPNDTNDGKVNDVYLDSVAAKLYGPKTITPGSTLYYGRNVQAASTNAQASNHAMWIVSFRTTSSFGLNGFGFMVREGASTGVSMVDGTQEWKVYLLNETGTTVLAESGFEKTFNDTHNTSYPYLTARFDEEYTLSTNTNYRAAIYARHVSTKLPVTELDLLGGTTPYVGPVIASTATGNKTLGMSSDNPTGTPTVSYGPDYGALQILSGETYTWGSGFDLGVDNTAMGVVNHGSDPSFARPNRLAVYWIGATPPSNANNADQWYDTTGD